MKTLDELRATPASVVCVHGASQRACDACECIAIEAESDGFKARVVALESAVRALRGGTQMEWCGPDGLIAKLYALVPNGGGS